MKPAILPQAASESVGWHGWRRASHPSANAIFRVGFWRHLGFAAALLWLPLCWGAGVELRPGTIIEFASLDEGRRIVGERDSFIQSMSQFDRCVRMQTSRAVTETEFLTYLTNQVRAWSEAEKTKVTTALTQIGSQIKDLNFTLPSQFFLVKTTGNEEGNAAYLRGASMILPQSMITGSAASLKRILAHEMFHLYLCKNPDMRGSAYSVTGFRLCNPIPIPQWLMDRRITDPNPGPHDFLILVKVDGVRTPCTPVFYSKSTNYTGGLLPDYLESKLLVLEETSEGYRPICSPDGIPRLLDAKSDVTDYSEQIGLNTSYTIHPEETLADNFAFAVKATSMPVHTPRVPYLLREVINHPFSAWVRLPAGRFWSSLEVRAGSHHVIQASTDLTDWVVCEYVTNAPPHLDLVDADAWLYGHRFFRARALDPPRFTPGDSNNMVWNPAGTFVMGSPATEVDRTTDEGPQTRVTLTSGFWLGKYEVTQAEYETIMGANPSHFPGLPNLPVECVSWLDATDYCARLTERERTSGRLPSGWIFRLPAEAEWEYAARAGTTNRFSFGDDPDALVIHHHEWFSGNPGLSTRAVGTRRPNPWGLHDMHGNVAEWCADWYGRYPGGSVTNSKGPTSGTQRVIRGGNFLCCAFECRSASRSMFEPDYRYNHACGFRLVLAPAGL